MSPLFYLVIVLSTWYDMATRREDSDSMAVKILTDSTADLPQEIVNQLGVVVVPQLIRFGDRVYREGIDISRDEFYSRLLSDGVHPSTSQPSPQEFVDAYRKIESQSADGILSVHVSHKLSGTYDSAMQGVTLAEIKYPIEVVDTLSVSMGLGLLVMLAARLAKEGMSLSDLAAEIKQRSEDIHLLGFFDTLKYLAAGGRIGKAKALIGSVLSVKPVVSLREGELQPAGQVRNRAKGMERLTEFLREAKPEELVVIHSTTPKEARHLADKISGLHPGKPIIVSQFSAAVGAHTGPGALFVGYRVKSHRQEVAIP